MIRLLAKVAAALSLVLCLAIAALWAESYRDSFAIWNGPFLIGSGKGRIILEFDNGHRAVRQALPYWTLVGFLGAWFVLLFWRVTRPRHVPGRCSVCGYDLRATPDRCPECGTPILELGDGAK
jgi:hypothetical protein